MTSKNFEELEIWQLARLLTGKIYKLTRDGPFARDFGLGNQIQRASVSVMSNIARAMNEAATRSSSSFLPLPACRGRFYACPLIRRKRVSCPPCIAYVNREEAEVLIDQHKKLSIMIHKFMEHLKASKFKGQKYKPPETRPETG